MPTPPSPRRSLVSGRATFAGYIKLDDTATYLGMTDRVMEHGRSLAGLAPSTHLRGPVPADGVYTGWIAGAWFGRASVSIDGRTVGTMRAELSWPAPYTDLGSTRWRQECTT